MSEKKYTVVCNGTKVEVTHHEKIEEFDMELTQQVIKYIVINGGTVSAVLVNDKTIPIQGA